MFKPSKREPRTRNCIDHSTGPIQSSAAITVPATEPELSAKVHVTDRLAPGLLTSRLVLLAGIGVFSFAIALTVRTYMPCPFWDEWAFIYQIANGAGPFSWHWLWSQHNEHRLVMTRLLVWLDLSAFGGKNISLFIEMFLAQVVNCIAICWVVEHLTPFPKSLKRTLQGLFAFCLFHPNQAENLTWAFQVSFVLCLVVGTLSLLAVAFFERITPRRRPIVLAGLAFAPLVAAVNLAGGLLLAPVVITFACLKGLRGRYTSVLALVYSVTVIAYLYGYRSPGGYSPQAALLRPFQLLVYILTYFDASWQLLLPVHYHVASVISIVALCTILIQIFRNREHASDFEVFCFAECTLILAIAGATAVGRLHFGTEQAISSRYQTPAMLYWACISSLVLIRFWRRRPAHLPALQRVVAIVIFLNLLLFPAYWEASTRRSNVLGHACTAIMSGHYDSSTAKELYPRPKILQRGAAFLREKWR